MLPVGLNPYLCNLLAVSIVINLGGDFESANDFMKKLLEDMVNGFAHVIQCMNTIGEKCVVYLDPVSLITYWPALSAFTDSMGHSADFFCSFCVFPESKGSAAATIVHTSKFVSRRMSLVRFDASMAILRNRSVLPESLRKYIGLKSNCLPKEATYFTEKLSQQLYLSINSSFQ